MGDRSGSAQRKQWSQAAGPDLSLRQLADSQTMESSTASAYGSEYGGRQSAEVDLSMASITFEATPSARPTSRPNLTKPELQLLRDSLMELDLEPRALLQGSGTRPSGPATIDEGFGSDEDEYSEIDDEVSSDSELESPKYESRSGEMRVMASEVPARQVRQIPSRPLSGHHRNAPGVPHASLGPLRPISGSPVRAKDLPEARDSNEDVVRVLKALSAENEAALRSSREGRHQPSSTSPVTESTSSSANSTPVKTGRPPPLQASSSPAKPRVADPRSEEKAKSKGHLPLARLETNLGGSGSPRLEDGSSTPTSATIKKLSSRLARLEPSKQRVLQQVLDKLEKAEASGNLDVSAMFTSLSQPRAASRLGGLGGASPPLFKGREHHQEITLRILSSHAGGLEVGLTEVELFTAEGEKIEILPEDLSLQGCISDASTLSRIVSGRSKTTNERHMWLGRLRTKGAIEVVLRTPAGSPAAAQLLVWNFNKSIPELGKGVREMQVYVDGDLTWQGTISRGCGNQTFDYATRIALLETPEAPAEAQAQRLSAEMSSEDVASQGKSLGELSNEELLEEFKRRSLPIPAETHQAEPRQHSTPNHKPREHETCTEHQKELQEEQRAGQDTKAASDGSPGSKPGNKTKLEGLRNRLSARRGHGPVKQGPPSNAKGPDLGVEPKPAAVTAAAPEAAEDGVPIWLAGSKITAPNCTTSKEAPRARPQSGRRAKPPEVEPGESPSSNAAPLSRQPALGDESRPVRGLEASLDSLEFFKKTQAGRLEKTLSTNRSKRRPGLEDTIEDVDAFIQSELGGLDDDEALILDELAQLNADPKPQRSPQGDCSDSKDAEGNFVIPTTPSGRVLELSILSTWGDPHYVGMCGVELFDSKGSPISVSRPSKQVSAQPASINELPEYSSDPRTPDKLVDGVYMTCDDLHVWLAPFDRVALNRVTIQLDNHVELGMIRIWNYNKSRIHSQRGVREVGITLDGTAIFAGEVRRAPGSLAEAPAHAECILFTEEEVVLRAIEDYDAKYLKAQAEAEQRPVTPPSVQPRGETASALEIVTGDVDDLIGTGAVRVGSDGRPMTSAVCMPSPPAITGALSAVPEEPGGTSRSRASSARAPKTSGSLLRGCELRIVVLATWGDPYYMGLTGLQIEGADGKPLPLTASDLDACPRDLNAIPGYSGDDRTLEKLLDGENSTTNDAHMWLAPMKMSTLSGGPVSADDPNGWLSIRLGRHPVEIAGLWVWNYNKSLEDTTRGLKAVQLFLDGKLLSPPGGHLFAKAPGRGNINFGQYLPLHAGLLSSAASACVDGPTPAAYQAGHEASAWLNALPDPTAAMRVWKTARQGRSHCALVRQDIDTPLLPVGYVLKLLLLSSWGDPHYVGLTGIQIVDAVRGVVQVPASCVSASPRSVADLPGMARDVRVPARLVDTPNSGSPSHSWLAPLASSLGNESADVVNCVTIVLDRPVMLAALRLWNYAKTPQRGVEEMEVMLDDLMIFKGYVRQAPTGLQGAWQHSILFHNDAAFIQAERNSVYSHLATFERESPIVLVNEKQFLSGNAAGSLYQEPGDRPSTSVVAV